MLSTEDSMSYYYMQYAPMLSTEDNMVLSTEDSIAMLLSTEDSMLNTSLYATLLSTEDNM